MRFRLIWRREPSPAGGLPDAKCLPALHYPLTPVPRVSVLGATLRHTPGVRCFPRWTCSQVMESRPQALAGSFEELATAAVLCAEGYMRLTDLEYPCLILTPESKPPLTEQQHHDLWVWFRVPVLEQIRSAHGELLAFECEAREGFHLVEGVEPSRLGGSLLPPCQCGLSAMRMDLLPRVAVAAAAD